MDNPVKESLATEPLPSSIESSVNASRISKYARIFRYTTFGLMVASIIGGLVTYFFVIRPSKFNTTSNQVSPLANSSINSYSFPPNWPEEFKLTPDFTITEATRSLVIPFNQSGIGLAIKANYKGQSSKARDLIYDYLTSNGWSVEVLGESSGSIPISIKKSILGREFSGLVSITPSSTDPTATDLILIAMSADEDQVIPVSPTIQVGPQPTKSGAQSVKSPSFQSFGKQTIELGITAHITSASISANAVTANLILANSSSTPQDAPVVRLTLKSQTNVAGNTNNYFSFTLPPGSTRNITLNYEVIPNPPYDFIYATQAGSVVKLATFTP